MSRRASWETLQTRGLSWLLKEEQKFARGADVSMACVKIEFLKSLGSQRLLGVAGPQLDAHGKAAGGCGVGERPEGVR